MNPNRQVLPRNGHTLVVCIVARISGCQNQKELSLEDQQDHAKEEVAEVYEGPVEYRVIATKGKGERLDRPELVEVEEAIRTGKLDFLVMEDVGRLVRGAEAVKLWGIAVDHGTRCIAPNDCVDTIDESWEEDLLAACRDHVGHNAHTSKRIKKKLMNRFKKFGGATALPIAGYIKPDGAKTYFDWTKDDAATGPIAEGLARLKETLNCSDVAEFLNSIGFSTGPFCKNSEWDGSMVRRFYKNPMLGGHPYRGARHTVKHHGSGRRVSVKNTSGEPHYLDCPHLAHVSAAELDEVNRLLKQKNGNAGRKKIDGVDPLWRRPRKRTKFPGQYARCWYCGHHYVWGGNGQTSNLMCSNSRQWHCWNSIGFNGQLATARIIDAIMPELYKLDGFDLQFRKLVEEAHRSHTRGPSERWKKLRHHEATLARQKENLRTAILNAGAHPMLQETLEALDARERELLQERQYLESFQGCELELPASIEELRHHLEQALAQVAMDSPECGTLLQQIVTDFHVYLVRLCDGGHLLPRARIVLNLAGHVADARHVPNIDQLLTKVITLDLFEQPPQRERIRAEAVDLAAASVTQREIARRLKDENPKLPIVQKAIALDAKVRELGLDAPYILVTEPPEDYTKLRRHRNSKYCFQALDGFEPPPL